MDLFDLFASISLDTSDFESGVEGASSSADEVADALESIGSAADEAESGLSSAGDAGEDAADGLDSVGDSADDASDGLEDVGDAGDSASGGIEDAASAADSAASSFDSLGDSASNAGDSFGVMDVALGGLVANGIQAAISSIGGLVTGTVQTCDNIDKMSQKIGISTDEYQEWAYICQICGSNVDNLRTGMKTLNNVISDAAAGSSSANEKLEAVGLSIEELNGLSQNEQLTKVVNALQNMESSAYRSAAANDLLGKMGTDLSAVFNLTTEEMEDMRLEAYDLGIILSEDTVQAGADLNDSMTRVKESFSGITSSLLGEVMPGLSDFLDFIASDVIGGIGGLMDGSTELGDVLNTVFDTITTVGQQAFEGLVSAVGDILPELLEALPELVTTITQFLLESIPEIVSAGYDLLTGIIEAIPDFIDSLLESLPDILEAIFGFFEGDSFDQMIESATNFFMAIIEAIPEIVNSLVENLPQIINTVINGLINAVPNVLNGAITMFTAIITSIPTIVADLVANLPEIITTIVTALINAAPDIFNAAVELLGNIVSTIPQIASDVLNAVPQIIEGLVNGLLNGVSAVVEAAKSLGSSILSGIKGFLGINSPSTVMQEQGQYITEGLVEGIENMPTQVDSILSQTESLIENWGSNVASNIAASANNMLSGFMDVLGKLPDQLSQMLNTALTSVTTWSEELQTSFTTTSENIFTTMSEFLQNLITTMSDSENTLSSNWNDFSNNWLNTVNETNTNISTAMSNTMTQLATDIQNALNGILTDVSNWGTEMYNQFTSIGTQTINGMIAGLDAQSGQLYSKIRSIMNKMIDEAMDALDIGSPSRVFRDDVGQMVGKGLALGLDDEVKDVTDSMGDLLSALDASDYLDSLNNSASVSASFDGSNGSASERAGVTVIQNIYSEAKTAADLMREARYEQQRAILMGVG